MLAGYAEIDKKITEDIEWRIKHHTKWDIMDYDSSLVSDLYTDTYGRAPSPVFWVLWNTGSDTDRECMWRKILADLNETEMETEKV
jgi:hypothetical protein